MLPSTQELRPSPTALWGHWLNHCLLSAPAFLWQRVLDNITKHGKEVGSHRNVISQKNATHILEGPCHKWWGIEERKNREEIDEQNQSGANEFPGTYHEKAWTWEHRSHWENWGREKQRKTTAELHEKPQPAVENQWSRDHRKNKKPRRVENHDRQRPNWIRHLERERESIINITTIVYFVCVS